MTESARILENLLAPSRQTKKTKRLEETLKDPKADSSPGWRFVVPPVFNDALDIRLTERSRGKGKTLVWTQGSNFAFKRGDVLYDHPKGYGTWSEALKKIKFCVQVVAARDVDPPTPGKSRDPGAVSALIFKPGDDRKTLQSVGKLETTQDGFIRFLLGQGGAVEEMGSDLQL